MEAGDHGTPPRSSSALVNILLQPSPTPDPTNPSPISDPDLAGQPKPELPRSVQQSFELNLRAGPPETALTRDGDETKYGGMFRKEVYTVQVFENTETPLVILALGRELEGAGGQEGVSFRIVGSNYGIFSVEEGTGDLVLTHTPDREQRDTYILRIKVNHKGNHIKY